MFRTRKDLLGRLLCSFDFKSPLDGWKIEEIYVLSDERNRNLGKSAAQPSLMENQRSKSSRLSFVCESSEGLTSAARFIIERRAAICDNNREKLKLNC